METEINTALQNRDGVRRRSHPEPLDSNLRKALKMACKHLRKSHKDAMLNFFWTFDSKLETLILEGDQVDLYEHPKKMELDGK